MLLFGFAVTYFDCGDGDDDEVNDFGDYSLVSIISTKVQIALPVLLFLFLMELLSAQYFLLFALSVFVNNLHGCFYYVEGVDNYYY